MGDYLPVSRYYATRADFESLGCAAAAPAAVPGGPGCRAVAPIVAFARNGVRVRRRALRVRGSARAFACAGRPRVTRVEVALRTRPRAGRCRTVGTRGRLSAPRRCARVHWLRARIRGRGWSLSRGLSLPAGRYLVLVRSRDGRGRRSRIVSRAARVR
jgi:hypothetical protein